MTHPNVTTYMTTGFYLRTLPLFLFLGRTGGKQLGNRWETGGEQVGNRWETGGEQVGNRWRTCGEQGGGGGGGGTVLIATCFGFSFQKEGF